MANAFSSWLERKGVGFQPTDIETKGKCLLSTLADVLWVIDGHLNTLAGRSYAILACFSGYNVPASTSEKRWSALLLKSMHTNFLSCWMSRMDMSGNSATQN